MHRLSSQIFQVTDISVITTGAAEKKGVVAPQLYADYAVLDGDLTVTLPPKVLLE